MKCSAKNLALILMSIFLLEGVAPDPGKARISRKFIKEENHCQAFFHIIKPDSEPFPVGSILRLNGNPLIITHFTTNRLAGEIEALYRKYWTSGPLTNSWIVPKEILKIATSIPGVPSPSLCQVILFPNSGIKGTVGFWVEEELSIKPGPLPSSSLPFLPQLEELLFFEEETSHGTSLTTLSEGDNDLGKTRTEIEDRFFAEGWNRSLVNDEEKNDDSLLFFQKGDMQCLVILSTIKPRNRTLAMITLLDNKVRH